MPNRFREWQAVVEAASPRAALDTVIKSRDPIDLVLTDVLMPEMRGPELANRLRALRPGLRVLFMSGYSDSTFLDARALETASYIQKPFTSEELTAKIRETLRRRSV